MIKPTFLGIDCGTSAVRACLINDRERRLIITRSPITTSESPLQTNESARHRTQNPNDWLVALDHCLGELFKEYPVNQVAAIAVDGTSSTLLLCDLDGQALTPALMYNDASSTVELKQLRQHRPLPAIALSATAGLPKILQLSRHVRRPALIQHQADWITGQLCDQYGFSDENNALKTGYDPVKRCWPDWVRQAIPGHLKIPDVVIPGTRIGTAGKWLQQRGFRADTKIIAGTTDSTAAFIATGITRFDEAVTTLGSTLVIKQLSKTPIEDTETGVYSQRLGDAWLAGGASNSGGNVLDKFFNVTRLQELSQQIDPNTKSNLDYYPLASSGERFPINDPNKQPILDPRPDADSDFLQGMLEGIANIEKAGYDKLYQLGTNPIKQVTTSGGGSVNPVWCVIRERILCVPVRQAKEAEAAYGAARLAKNETARSLSDSGDRSEGKRG